MPVWLPGRSTALLSYIILIILRPFFRFGCEYTENESWVVTPSTTCTSRDACMTLDHHLAAHGPTGTTYWPPGLVFTPNRYLGLSQHPACLPQAPKRGSGSPGMPPEDIQRGLTHPMHAGEARARASTGSTRPHAPWCT